MIALYFLKFKRQPLEVPSTYLWHRTIEDLHVNSLWQRIRTSLLLFLQLLFVALLMIATFATQLAVDAIDRPAADFFGRQFGQHAIQRLKPHSVVGSKGQDRGNDRTDELRRRGHDHQLFQYCPPRAEFYLEPAVAPGALDRIEPTNRTTSLDDALALASGLANPGGSAAEGMAEPIPATMYIFSDGRFRDVQAFSLGDLKPVFVPLGDPSAGKPGHCGL